MIDLDPRAQLAWAVSVAVGAMVLGTPGLAAGAAIAVGLIAFSRAWRHLVRLLLALAPVAFSVILFDALAGQTATGFRLAARLLCLAAFGLAFARVVNGEALIAGLRALRVPYAVTFVLVAGGRAVPTVAAELSTLRNAARLRGVVLDGPPWRQLRGWRLLLVPLLVSTVRRGLQLGEAMEARAFGVHQARTSRVRLSWRARDSLAVLLALVYLIGLLAAAVAL
jgi:energy-coupling factor transport system permease protein